MSGQQSLWVENLRIQCEKEKARSSFYKDPFRFVRGLFTKEKCGSSETSKRALVDHLKTGESHTSRYATQSINHTLTRIPVDSKLPVKSLWRWYNASLKDTEQSIQIREESIKGLVSIDKPLLPGKLKLW